MDTVQILCSLRDVGSLLDVFPSDLLPQSITRTCTVIVNADPYTERVSHWLAIRFLPKSASAYYFDNYGLSPLVPSILAFIRRYCATWDYNKRQLQGLTSDVCGKYCCLFALYADRGYTSQHFVSLFDACNADRQVEQLFAAEFGAELPKSSGWGQCCRSCL
jgi:hypothetical protein